MPVQAVQVPSRAVEATQPPFAFFKIDQCYRRSTSGILASQPTRVDHDVLGVKTVVFKMQGMQLPDQDCHRLQHALTLARARPAVPLPVGGEILERPVTGQFARHQNAALVPVGILCGKQHRFRHCNAGRLAAHQNTKLTLAGEPPAQWMAHAAVDVVFLAFDEHLGAWRQAVSIHGAPAPAAPVACFHLVQAQCPPGLELVQPRSSKSRRPTRPGMKSRRLDHVVLLAIRCRAGEHGA